MNFVRLLFAVSLSAPADPARLMLLDASECKFAFMQTSLPETTTAEKMTYDQERAEARDDLGRHAGTAITDASNSADLELAIKEFYAAAWSYCEAPSDATDVEYEAKKKALDEMLQSAGR
jgi:hypothetical protein